jgi:hypothetical protein
MSVQGLPIRGAAKRSLTVVTTEKSSRFATPLEFDSDPPFTEYQIDFLLKEMNFSVNTNWLSDY